MKIFLTLILFLLLPACSAIESIIKTPEKVMFSSNVSEKVSFAIIPFNDFLAQQNYMSLVQGILIRSGLNVVNPQVLNKEIEERKQSQSVSVEADRSEQPSLSSTERYRATEISGTDYIVETAWSGYSGTVRIIRSKDKKVLGVYSVSDDWLSEQEFQMSLESLGLIKRVP